MDQRRVLLNFVSDAEHILDIQSYLQMEQWSVDVKSEIENRKMDMAQCGKNQADVAAAPP